MQAKKIWFDDSFIYVETIDAKIGKMPLNWFPNLKTASNVDLQKFELWSNNTWIHWENLKEDLSVEGFFNYNKQNQLSN